MINTNGITSNELFSTNKFIQDFCLVADYIGFSKDEFAQAIGLSLECIDEPQGIISLHYIIESYRVLLDYTKDELLGIQTKSLPRGAISLMIKSACSEKTLSKALTAIFHVNRICQSSITAQLIIENDIVRWQFSLVAKKSNFSLFALTMLTRIANKILSMLIKKEVPLLYASFVDEEPINICDYQFLYQCPVKFNQPYNEIVFDKSWLSKPILCQ